jgi:hypothetical protein
MRNVTPLDEMIMMPASDMSRYKNLDIENNANQDFREAAEALD